MLSRLNSSTIETHLKHLRLQMFHKIIHSIADVSLPDYIAHRSLQGIPEVVNLNLYSQTQLLILINTVSFLLQFDCGTLYLVI